jgi:hypothetical protein
LNENRQPRAVFYTCWVKGDSYKTAQSLPFEGKETAEGCVVSSYVLRVLRKKRKLTAVFTV